MTANGANKITDDFLNLINIFETNITGKRVAQRISVAPKMQTHESETKNTEPVLVQQNDFTTNNNVKDAPCASPHIDKPVSSNEEKKQILTPAVMKKEFLRCTRCPVSNLNNRVLGEGCDFKPAVFIITDNILSDEEREYLDTILKAFHLNTETNTYVTSLVKCASNSDIPCDAYVKCSKFLKMQFMLYRPQSAIAFGKSSSSFLESLKKKEEFKYTAFISTLAPFDIKNNREEKKKLIASFNAMAELIHLARV